MDAQKKDRLIKTATAAAGKRTAKHGVVRQERAGVVVELPKNEALKRD